MKTRKSRIYREPGIIRWKGQIPPGASIRIYVDVTGDNKKQRFGPFTNPTGTRFPFLGTGKFQLHVELGVGGFKSPTLEKVWIHRHDEIIEFGGDAGW